MLNTTYKFEKAFYEFDLQDPTYRIDLKSGNGGAVPSKEAWQKAKRMIGFMKVLYNMTCRISGSLYVTSTLFLHEIYKLYCLLDAWIKDHDKELSEMSKRMKEKFDKYWGVPKKMNKVIFFVDEQNDILCCCCGSSIQIRMC